MYVNLCVCVYLTLFVCLSVGRLLSVVSLGGRINAGQRTGGATHSRRCATNRLFGVADLCSFVVCMFMCVWYVCAWRVLSGDHAAKITCDFGAASAPVQYAHTHYIDIYIYTHTHNMHAFCTCAHHTHICTHTLTYMYYTHSCMTCESMLFSLLSLLPTATF